MGEVKWRGGRLSAVEVKEERRSYEAGDVQDIASLVTPHRLWVISHFGSYKIVGASVWILDVDGERCAWDLSTAVG